MKIPRIVLADERKIGMTPPSIVFLASMKRAGFPIKVFYCGLKGSEISLLKSVLEDDITILHPKVCHKTRVIRTLFELAADPNKLNIIVCELGTRAEDRRDCSVNWQASDVAALLDCSIVLACFSESVPVQIDKIVSEFVDGMKSKNPGVRVDGVVYVNQFDQRSFQLAENIVGSHYQGLSFGYIPQELVPRMPKYEDICSPATNSKSTFLIRAVATRVGQMYEQVDYRAIDAIGRYNSAWKSAEKIETIKITRLPEIAIINEIPLSSEGNNSELLFRALGCKTERVSIREAFTRDFGMYYFPHGLGVALLDTFASSIQLVSRLKAELFSNKIMIMNGASAHIFAEKVLLPDGSEVKGVGVLPGTSQYAAVEDIEAVPASCDTMINGVLSHHGETIGAYNIPWAKIERAALKKIQSNWLCTELEVGGGTGSLGWETYRGVFATVALDLWSNVEGVRRALYAKI